MTRTAAIYLILPPLLAACGSASCRKSSQPAARSAKPAAATQKVTLHPATAGLLARHRQETPLLEKEACIPAVRRGEKSRCHLQRVYRDGSLYLLSPQEGSAPRAWHRLARIKKGALEQLERLFAEVCGGTDPAHGNENGTFTYRVDTPRCTRELVVTGQASGGLKRLDQVADLINQNLIRNRSGATSP